MLTKGTKAEFFTTSYLAGKDCGLFGVSSFNCHFSYFSSPENTAEWKRGKRDGEKQSNDSNVASPAEGKNGK